jgi:hypothetical protein
MDKNSRKGTLNAWTEECKNNWRGSKIKKKREGENIVFE